MSKRLYMILVLIGLLILTDRIVLANPSFTETFSSGSYIYLNTGYLADDKLNVGFPYIYSWASWNAKWGDIEYYNGYIYVVWSDRRYNDIPNIFLQKIDANTGNIVWVTNIEVSEWTNVAIQANGAFRPDIAIYNSANIYIAYGTEIPDHNYVYLVKINDSGTSPTIVWRQRADGTYGNDTHPRLQKIYMDVDDANNVYVGMNFQWIGSGHYEYIEKFNSTGVDLGWGNPGLDAIRKDFSMGNEVKYWKGFLYYSGEHWMWVPSRDEGSYAQKISTNGTLQWGTIGSNIANRGTLSGYGNQNYKCNAVAVGTNSSGNTVIYYVWSDHRNGNEDIWVAKLNENGDFVWSTKVVGIATSSLDEGFADAEVDSYGYLYITYMDSSYRLYLVKVAEEDGSVVGTKELTPWKESSGSQISYPRIEMDNNNAIYIAFYENSSNGRITILKFNNFSDTTPAWLVRDVQDIEYKKRSYMISRDLQFSPPVGTVTSAHIDAIFDDGGNQIKFYLSPDGNLFYEAQTNTTVNFTNIGSSFRVKIEFINNGLTNQYVDMYTVIADTYYTGDLGITTNTNIGVDFLGYINKNPIYQSDTYYVLADGVRNQTIYIAVSNSGNVSGGIYLSGSAGNELWDIKYYDGTTDITPQITGANGYLISSLAPNTVKYIKLVVTPSVSLEDGQYTDIYLYTSASAGKYLHDSASIRIYAWKHLPDLAINTGSGYNQLNYRETTPSTQIFTTNINSTFSGFEEYITNTFIVSNAGVTNSTMELSFSYSYINSTNTNWSVIISNISTSQQISTSPYYISLLQNSVNTIQIITKAYSSTSTNSRMEISIRIRSTNGQAYTDTLREDNIKFSYSVIKVQPDLIIATRVDFSDGKIDNNYTFTNASLVQEITQRTVNNKPVSFFIKVQNDGYTGEYIKVKAEKITNTGWTESYSYTNADITSDITNGGWYIYLNPGQFATIIATYTPDDTVESGDTPRIKITAYSSNKPPVQDIVFASPRNIKVYPDILISYVSNMGFISNNVYGTSNDVKGQILSARIERGETKTYYILLNNDSPTDPDTFHFRGTAGNNNWDVKYYVTNSSGWLDITSYATNDFVVSNIGIGESLLLKCEVTPLAGASADEQKLVFLKLWSDWVTNQQDWAILSNVCIEVQPDIIVQGLGNNVYESSTYTTESNKVSIIAGIPRTYTITLENDGRSVENYTLKVNATNVGGSIYDWIYTIKVVEGGSTNDITANVTNDGWTSLFNGLQQKDIYITVEVTNTDGITNINATNGIVSNQLVFFVDFWSGTKTNKVDKGMLTVMIERGIPDFFHEAGYFRKDIVDSDWSEGNLATYGIVLKYPGNFKIYIGNIGIYTDDFIVFAEVSNEIGEIGNWIYDFYDKEGNNITSLLTNSSIGINITNLGVDEFYPITFRVVNSNGFVGDTIAVRFSVRSKYPAVREDKGWFKINIVEGFPEITASNVTYNIGPRGIGQFSIDSYFSDKIESGETNHYILYLSNTAPIDGNPPFVLKEERVVGDEYFDILYYTNGIPVARDVLRNGLMTNAIYNGGNTNTGAEPKAIKVDVLVTPKSSAVSGNQVYIQYKLILVSNDNVYDSFYITNTLVNPQVTNYFSSTNVKSITLYRKPGESAFVEIRVKNLDVVPENIHITGDASSSYVETRYYELVGSLSNDISEYVTNGGWIASNVLYNSYRRIGLELSLSTSATSGYVYHSRVLSYSEKNPSRNDYVDVYLEAVKAKVDVSVEGVGEDVYLPISQSFTGQIEYRETNTYVLKLDNDEALGGPVDIVLKEVGSYNITNYEIRYFVGTNDITSLVRGEGWQVPLPATKSTNIIVKIILTNNIPSGSLAYIDLSAYTKLVSGLQDTIRIYQEKVTPSVDIYFADNTRDKTNFLRPSSSIDYEFRVKNLDSISAKMLLKATPSTSSFTLSYYYLYDTSTNDITADITNTGWVSPYIPGNSYIRLLVRENISSNAISGTSKNIYISAQTLKNLNISNSIHIYTEVVEGKADIAISNLYTGETVGEDVYLPMVQELTSFIKTNQQKSFHIIVGNDIDVGEPISFYVSESFRYNLSGYEIHYYDGAEEISLSNYLVSLGPGEKKTIEVRVVLTNPNVPSGSYGYINIRQYAKDVSGIEDAVKLSFIRINPIVDAYFSDSSTNKQDIVSRGSKNGYDIILKNLDIVSQKLKFKAVGTVSTNINVKFYYITTNTNDITAGVFNGTWISGNVDFNDTRLIRMEVEVSSNARTGDEVCLNLLATPAEDTNIVKTLIYKLQVIDTRLDIYITGATLTNFGINTIYPATQRTTNKILINTTNTYTLTIRNTETGSNVVVGLNIENSGNTNYFEILLKDGITTLSLPHYISLGGSEEKTLQLLIISKTNISGKILSASIKAFVTNRDVIRDELTLDIFSCSPSPSLRTAGPGDRYWRIDGYSIGGRTFYTYKNANLNYYVAVVNQDVIWDSYRVWLELTNIGGDLSSWNIAYYTISGQEVNLTLGTNTGTVDGNSFYAFRISIQASEKVKGGETLMFIFHTESIMDPTYKDVITNIVIVKKEKIVGKVVDMKTGLGISNATIVVKDPYGSVYTTSTTNGGGYEIDVYPAYNMLYELSASAKGYISETTNIIYQITTNIVEFKLIGLNMTEEKQDIRIFPNPISVGVEGRIVYALPEDTKELYIAILDINGRLVKELVKEQGVVQKGVYVVKWYVDDTLGNKLPRGVYLLLIKTDRETVVKKIFVK